MNIQSEEYEIINELIYLNDVEVLQKIRQLLRQASRKQKAMTLEEFYDRIKATEKAFYEGEIVTHSTPQGGG